MSSVSGRCLCGALRFRLEGELRHVVLCHCSQCRRWHGHAGAYTRVPATMLAIDDDRSLTWYRSSERARRGFCRECGSSLFWERSGSGTISVAAGTLEAPTGLSTRLQIFAEDAGDYYEIDDRIQVRPSGDSGT